MIIERLKTLGLVAVVTVLIWIWAEGESLSKDEVSPRVELVGGRDLVVVADDPEWTGTVKIRLRGSTSAIDRGQRLLSAPLQITSGAGGVPSTPGAYTIDLSDAIRASPDFRRTGATLERVDPPSVHVVIEQLQSVTRPIKARLAGPGGAPPELDGEPVLEVATATIKGPSSVLEKLGDAPIVASVEAEQVARLRDDRPETLSARLVLPEGLAGNPRVSVSPARVSMVVRLVSRTESWVVATMPVWIAVPPTEGAKWTVELPEPFIRNVTVTGPKEMIRAMRDRGEVPAAYVDLTSDDLERRVTSKAVVFSHLPTPLRFSADQATVAVKIVARPTPEKKP